MAKARKKAANVPDNETKAQRFVRLAQARVGKALKAIELIGNLSGSGYEYTPEQVEKITAALTNRVTATMENFSTKPKTEVPAFTL